MDNDKVNKWNVAIGLDQTPEGMSEIVGEKEYAVLIRNGGEVTQIFTPQKDAVYYMGWHITSIADMGDSVLMISISLQLMQMTF